MNKRFILILIGLMSLFSYGCTTTRTLELGYTPAKIQSTVPAGIRMAIIPFEDDTWNGQENAYWVGQAPLYGIKLFNPNTISYLVTRGVKSEMEAYGYQLSPDEIYTMQISRNDIRTLLKKIPHLNVDFLVGGSISHFFVEQVGRFIADVEIEAFLVRPPSGETVWSKKIGHREVRIPFLPDDFSFQSQLILNNLMEKTIEDLFRNSDFRSQTKVVDK
jgi:hypothetical protein